MSRPTVARYLFCFLLGVFILTGCGGETSMDGASAVSAEGQIPVTAGEESDYVIVSQSQAEKTYAQGKVVPVRNAELSFVSSGVVAELNFDIGEQVKQGQVIARLSGVEKLEAAIVSAEKELLLAEQEYNQIVEQADLEFAEALVRMVEAEDALEDAEKKRTSKEYKHGNAVSIDVARADLKVLEKQLEDYQAYFDHLSGRDVDDPERSQALIELNKIRHQRDTALANLNYLTSMPNALEVAKADASLTFAQADYDDAKSEVDKMAEGPHTDKIAMAEMRMSDAQAKLAAAQAALSEIDLIAPFDGTIVANDLKVGEMVSLGAAPIVLADLSEWQVITTDLSELNVVNIHIGDEVKVTFDAIPELVVGGRTSHVDVLGKDQLGDITYSVTVELNRQDKRLRWNMTSTVVFQP